MKTKYRVIRDDYNGFTVQVKRWWLPIWIQASHKGLVLTNSFSSLERAKGFIEQLQKKPLYQK